MSRALMTPPVSVRPSLEARPPVPTASPEEANVLVPVTPDSNSRMPSESVSPEEDLSPPPPTASPALVMVLVAVSPSQTKVEVACHVGSPPVPNMRTCPLVPAASSENDPADPP